jgi:hypothetical protein
MAPKKKTIEIEAFDDDDELDDDEADAAALAEAEKLAAQEAEDDDEDDDDEAEESDDDEDDEEDDDLEVADEDENKFAPYVYIGENTSWTLENLFEEVNNGQTVYVYDAVNELFFKLQPVVIGEIGQ